MPLPTDGPATLEGVKPFLHIAADDETEDAELEDLVAAVNVIVRGWSVASVVDDEDWPANVSRGADMLAARLRRRETSPAGTAPATQADAVYVARQDPDITMLLKLDAPGIA